MNWKIFDFMYNPNKSIYLMTLFFIAEIGINTYVIRSVRYTEIDWVAYMQEVEGFLNGTYDYKNLSGDTGPLVYPAGFVYIYSLFYIMTNNGKNILLGQIIFMFLYLLNLFFVFVIYHKVKKLPPYIYFFMCCTSYRVHSLFVLRLFNDPVAMLILYASICLMLFKKWRLASVVFSLAVSVKMNILLFAPGLLLIFILNNGIMGTIINLSICAAIQLIVGLPFLLTNATNYMTRAFELNRQFMYKWTVNWRFLSEAIFLDKFFQIFLLVLHITFVIAFVLIFLRSKSSKLKLDHIKINHEGVVLILFVSNFIGICFSRTLHYQFYVWYYHSIPFLLWSTKLPIILRLLLMGLIELSWNIYPSQIYSSLLLHACHAIILFAIFDNISKVKTIDKMDSLVKNKTK